MSKERKPVLVRSPAKIGALASSVRQEIIDTMESLSGEATVAEIASQLGRHADGLYYHLRQLTRHGLLVELEGDETGKRYRTAAPPGSRFNLHYERGRQSNVEPVSRVVASMTRMARRDFERALRSGSATVSGDRRDLWASRIKGWVSDAEVAELNVLIKRINALLHRPRTSERTRLIAFVSVISPLDAKPLRRRSSRK